MWCPRRLILAFPSWEYDPTFDIRNHVREVTLKHGTDRELKTLAGKILSTVMDRQHPLWDLTLVHGLKGNRTGLIFRLHHCLADGIAGVGIMNVMMDASPVAAPLPRRKLRLRVPPPRDVLTSLANGVVDSYSDFIKRILDALADVSSMAERLASERRKSGPGRVHPSASGTHRVHRALPLQRSLPRTAEIRLGRNSTGRSQSHTSRLRNQRK